MAKIKVYSTASCPFCLGLKGYLKDNHIEFEDFDVAEDENAREEMINKSGQMGVPVIEINGKLIIGFDKEKLEAELKESSSE